jgi:hypothetical protein
MSKPKGERHSIPNGIIVTVIGGLILTAILSPLGFVSPKVELESSCSYLALSFRFAAGSSFSFRRFSPSLLDNGIS